MGSPNSMFEPNPTNFQRLGWVGPVTNGLLLNTPV